jgi:hypothetical protein
MAIITEARMQQLRGKYADLKKDSMLAGEWAICDDHNPIVRTNTGYKEVLTKDDEDYYEQKVQEIEEAIANTNTTIDGANKAVTDAVKDLNDAKDTAISEMSDATTANTEKVDNAISDMQSATGTAVSDMQTATNTAVENMQNVTGEATTNMQTATDEAIADLDAYKEQTTATLTKTVDDAVEQAKTDVSDTITQAKADVKDAVDEANEVSSLIKTEVTEALGINDAEPSDTSTYSSKKIEELFGGDSVINDEKSSDNTTYSSDKINELIANIEPDVTKAYVDEAVKTVADRTDDIDLALTEYKTDNNAKVEAVEKTSESHAESIEELEKVAHSHENKTVLDNLTQEVIDDAHKHDNSDVLDKLGESDDGNLLFDGKEIQGGGGGGIIIPPKNPTDITVKELDGKLTVYWSDPEDNVVEGTTFATWAGTILVINDDHAPTNEKDGTVVINNTVRDAYATEGLDIEGLTNNQKYYLYFVPYTTAGVYGYSDDNRRIARPAKVALDDVTDTSVTAADKSITVKWTNPEETKTVNGVTATWAKTLVVLKADSAPEDETDGTVYESTTYSEKSHVFTVENGHDYYVAFFVISDLESVKRTDVDGSFATYATLTVTTEETTLIDQIVMVTWTDGDEEKSLTGSFGVMGFAQFKIPYMGAVTVSSTDGSDTAEGMTRIKEWGACSIAIDFSTIKPLSIITPDQLTKVIQGYYAKTITLAQIQSVWSVGDTVEFDIAAMAATGVGESHVAQTQAFVVLDFNHDTLVTATGGKSNAQKRKLVT